MTAMKTALLVTKVIYNDEDSRRWSEEELIVRNTIQESGARGAVVTGLLAFVLCVGIRKG
jgi:hypothetical protein